MTLENPEWRIDSAVNDYDLTIRFNEFSPILYMYAFSHKNLFYLFLQDKIYFSK